MTAHPAASRPPRSGWSNLIGTLGALAAVVVLLAPHAGHAVARTKRRRALREFKAGVSHYRADRFEQASRRFRVAFALDPRPVYLFNAARASERGGDRDLAARDYAQLLDMKNVPGRVRTRAGIQLAEIRAAKRREAEAAARATRRERARLFARTQARLRRSDSLRAGVGWATAATGAAVAVAGGWLLESWSAGKAKLDARAGEVDARGRVIGIDAQTYNRRMDALDADAIIGTSVLGAGVVAAGVGVWLLTTRRADPPQVTLAPVRGGLWGAVALLF